MKVQSAIISLFLAGFPVSRGHAASCEVYRGFDCSDLGWPLADTSNYEDTGVLHNEERRQLDEYLFSTQVNDTVSDDGLHLLERRGKRAITICIDIDSMVYLPPLYPSASDEDWYGAETWKTCNNYQLAKTDQADIAPGRAWADEHVLELQMIKSFTLDMFGGNIQKMGRKKPLKYQKGLAVHVSGEEDSMCQYLKKFWGKPNGQVQDKNTWDFVASAWPSSKANEEHHSEEMVKLDGRVNGVKARVFGESAIYDKQKQDDERKKIDMAHKFIADVKEMILLSQYMNDARIQAILKAQGDRIRDNFEEAERVLEQKNAAEPLQYVKQGLDGMWAQWLRTRVAKADNKLRDELKVHADILDNFIRQRKEWVKAQKKLPDDEKTQLASGEERKQKKLLKEMKWASKQAKQAARDGNVLITNPW